MIDKRHGITRRMVLKLGAAALPAFAVGDACASPWGRGPRPKLVRSELSIAPFGAPLPLLTGTSSVPTTGSTKQYRLVAKAAEARIIPGYSTKVWAYDGLFPGPVIEALEGDPISVEVQNELPEPMVHHLHGGHTDSQSDGFPTDLILPVGMTSYPTHHTGARIALGSRVHRYPNQQRGATLWYHDHTMDRNGYHLWQGLMGLYLLRDNEEMKLPLPSGDFEIPLVLCDRSFSRDGNFHYPVDPQSGMVEHEYMGGVLGDVNLVNGAPWPVAEVKATLYRLRIVNASNARDYEIEFQCQGKVCDFVQIGTDGGLLAAPVTRRKLRLSQAERADLVIDFTDIPVGSSVELHNAAAHGTMRQVMRFNIHSRVARPSGSIPQVLSSFQPMRRNLGDHRRDLHFSFSHSKGWCINGQPFDPERTDALVANDTTELWRISSDQEHPVHIHGVHFQVISHGQDVAEAELGWKDTIMTDCHRPRELIVPFRGLNGRYVFHCHNLEHEDMGMMATFEVI
jgi:spore coat protein A